MSCPSFPPSFIWLVISSCCISSPFTILVSDLSLTVPYLQNTSPRVRPGIKPYRMDDPFDWDVDRVVLELCSLDRAWFGIPSQELPP
ncbi:hypothetical protein F5B18DRAFT_151791 [Nemania serpens]|nr:hypothetical protein F5B18DRAFT_151791 [Nemania serpens]